MDREGGAGYALAQDAGGHRLRPRQAGRHHHLGRHPPVHGLHQELRARARGAGRRRMEDGRPRRRRHPVGAAGPSPSPPSPADSLAAIKAALTTTLSAPSFPEHQAQPPRRPVEPGRRRERRHRCHRERRQPDPELRDGARRRHPAPARRDRAAEDRAPYAAGCRADGAQRRHRHRALVRDRRIVRGPLREHRRRDARARWPPRHRWTTRPPSRSAARRLPASRPRAATPGRPCRSAPTAPRTRPTRCGQANGIRYATPPVAGTSYVVPKS